MRIFKVIFKKKKKKRMKNNDMQHTLRRAKPYQVAKNKRMKSRDSRTKHIIGSRENGECKMKNGIWKE